MGLRRSASRLGGCPGYGLDRRLKADSHIACRSPAMPCRKGFRMCLSHLIYAMRPCLIHTCHTMPMPCSDHAVHLKATAWPSREGRAVSLRRTAWSEHDLGSVNQTRPHCVNQMGETHSKPLATLHGRGTAWARHAMCESALISPRVRADALAKRN